MFITNKIRQLKHVSIIYKIKLLMFQLLKITKLPYYNRLYLINSFLTTHLIRYNGFLIKENENSFTSYFRGLASIDKKEVLLTLRKPPSSDFNVFNQVFVNEEYRPLINLLEEKNAINESLFVIDAGGNIGAFSVYLNCFLPDASFLIIEPDESNCKFLNSNITHNEINVRKIIKGGLWSSDGYLEIKRDFRDQTDWAIRVQESQKPNNLKAYSLKGIMTNLEINIIDILKIDIEGSEKELFSDKEKITEVLKKVRFLCIEIHDEFQCREIITDILINNGFVLREYGETTFGYNKNLVN